MTDTDTAYFQDLTPREQLNDLMHKYAQVNGLPYGDSWREFERRYEERYRIKIWYMRYSYCQDHQVRLTMPAFLETTERLDQALVIAHEMTGNIMKEDSRAVQNDVARRSNPRELQPAQGA